MGFNQDTANKKERAIQLRLHGKSYGQIQKQLQLSSKGTLSGWFKNLRLPPSSKKRLEKNQKAATERGLHKFNEERSKRIVQENEAAFKGGESMVGRLSRRELLLVGAALYWGEGTKVHPNPRSPYLSFSNSDPEMVQVYMRFLREVINVSEERIRAGIHLYPGNEVNKARAHWATITGLPKERFYIHKQVSRASKGIKPWNKLPHGTVAIRVHGRIRFSQVSGVISGIARAR